MASKTGKKANAAARSNAPQPKDDGRRYIVVRDDRQIYSGPGTTLAEAERLCNGLVFPAMVEEVDTEVAA